MAAHCIHFAVEYVGSELAPRTDTLTSGIRGSVLLENMRFGTGAVTSFQAYVLQYFPIRFQVWRRAGSDIARQGTTGSFTLVGEKRVVPADPLGMLTVSNGNMGGKGSAA